VIGYILLSISPPFHNLTNQLLSYYSRKRSALQGKVFPDTGCPKPAVRKKKPSLPQGREGFEMNHHEFVIAGPF
jgi:hypothetical protein